MNWFKVLKKNHISISVEHTDVCKKWKWYEENNSILIWPHINLIACYLKNFIKNTSHIKQITCTHNKTMEDDNWKKKYNHFLFFSNKQEYFITCLASWEINWSKKLYIKAMSLSVTITWGISLSLIINPLNFCNAQVMLSTHSNSI